MNELDQIIEQLEHQRTAIDNALEALRGVAGQTLGAKKRPGRPKKVAGKKRGLTSAGRKALSENMSRMWAAKRAQAKKTVRKARKKRAVKEA